MFTQLLHRIISTISIVLMLFVIGLLVAQETKASYRPAPNQIRVAAHRYQPPPAGSAAKRAWVVCRLFTGHRCDEALNVAWCESSLRPWAGNGQYRGIFQMGSGERSRYGDGSTAWAQTRAAFKYYSLSGWSPWECRPYGSG